MKMLWGIKTRIETSFKSTYLCSETFGSHEMKHGYVYAISFWSKMQGAGSLINVWKTNWKPRPTVLDEWLRITCDHCGT